MMNYSTQSESIKYLFTPKELYPPSQKTPAFKRGMNALVMSLKDVAARVFCFGGFRQREPRRNSGLQPGELHFSYVKNKKGLSLVELMIAVSILSIGIVLILRSFLSSASTLDSMYNRIKAMQLVEIKINDLEQESKEAGGVTARSSQQELELGLRPATEKLEITPLEVEGFKDINLDEVRVSLSWQEAGKFQDAILVTYLPKKK